MKNTKKPGPIEVWLTQRNMVVTCRVVFEDETVEYCEVNSLSMRGAQREMTGHFIKDGYTPVDRWQSESDGPMGLGAAVSIPGQPRETFRQFKPA